MATGTYSKRFSTGFGKTYRRADMERLPLLPLWSYAMVSSERLKVGEKNGFKHAAICDPCSLPDYGGPISSKVAQ